MFRLVKDGCVQTVNLNGCVQTDVKNDVSRLLLRMCPDCR